MEKTWMYMVECAIESEINRYTTANPADIYFDEGNLCGARTCALIAGYPESYISDTLRTVEELVEGYIKGGGNPYEIHWRMHDIYFHLRVLGFDGNIRA